MDDPSTYLVRDADYVCVVLADSVSRVMDAARQYGVSIQVNMAGLKGVRVVVTENDANAIIAQLPPTTPWSVISFKVPMTTYGILANYFGPPQTMAKALGVATEGIAWRPTL
jgi:hypothetical protein